LLADQLEFRVSTYQFYERGSKMSTPIEMAQWYLKKRDAGGAIRALQQQGTRGDRDDFEAMAALASEVRGVTSKRSEQVACDLLIEHAHASIARLSTPPPPVAVATVEATTPGSVPGTKICPRCAEEVKQAAVVCRFCGHEFGEATDTNGAAPSDGTASTIGRTESTATSGVAIAAFITSLVGLWIAAIPLGISAQRAIDRSEGRIGGRGFATAGIVLGVLGLIGTIVLVIVIISAASHSNPGCTYTYNATGGCVPGT
jgi:hypothetical protein